MKLPKFWTVTRNGESRFDSLTEAKTARAALEVFREMADAVTRDCGDGFSYSVRDARHHEWVLRSPCEHSVLHYRLVIHPLLDPLVPERDLALYIYDGDFVERRASEKGMVRLQRGFRAAIIETDGPRHEEPEQRAFDRGNDNALFCLISLPTYRIPYTAIDADPVAAAYNAVDFVASVPLATNQYEPWLELSPRVDRIFRPDHVLGVPNGDVTDALAEAPEEERFAR